ncbi:ABC transporter substrate-binding protein [Tateyamaria sp.]|uniref:ABC transporter substrate-binding protein n=1 Tax=Tateyamaria sp. TaxID=1929288 RepID=UPI003B2147C8
MRVIHFTASLILALWANASAALEVEEQRTYPGTGPTTLRILSTADLDVFEPFLLSFQASVPEIGIDYTVSSSAEVFRAVAAGEAFDVVISSAMDLQFRLANDGFAQSFVSDATKALQDWAKWRNLIFAFTSEPAVAVISTRAFAGLPVPRTRQDLISILRENPERFAGTIGTYDVRSSGLGYLFATQEARISDAYWRLSEVMGRLDPHLYCCSAQMIDDVSSGRLALAYNVLGSYAGQRLAGPEGEGLQIILFEDFDNVMLRTALIPNTATAVTEAGAFVDALLEVGTRTEKGEWVLPPLAPSSAQELSFGPIRLGPTLLVYLDPLNRRAFLESWQSAIEQTPD